MLTVHTRTGWSILCFTKISQQYTNTDMGGVYCALQRLVSSTQYSKQSAPRRSQSSQLRDLNKRKKMTLVLSVSRTFYLILTQHHIYHYKQLFYIKIDLSGQILRRKIDTLLNFQHTNLNRPSTVLQNQTVKTELQYRRKREEKCVLPGEKLVPLRTPTGNNHLECSSSLYEKTFKIFSTWNTKTFFIIVR